MNPRIWIAVAFGSGLFAGAIGQMVIGRPSAPRAQVVASPEPVDCDDEEGLAAANANLVNSLQECNRRLASQGQPRVAASVTPTAPVASVRERGQRGGRQATPPDWERLSRQGVVPYSIPCIRDTPVVPSQRQLDRLGLAPHDGDVLRDAYAKSNQRTMAQLQPLCARVLGSPELAGRVGPAACMSAIVDSARKENPDKMQAALVRVGEVNAGKREMPKAGAELEPVEALLLGFSAESKAFEADLAASLGPDDAHRIATSRGLCSERGTVRAKPEPSN